MRNELLKFLIGIVASLSICISSFAGEVQKTDNDKATDLNVQVAFYMKEIELAPILPFSPKNAKARAQKGFTFLIAGLGTVTTKTKILTSHFDVNLSDSKGKSYNPIAFGFPLQGSKAALTMIGRLGNGDMFVVGSDDTFVGIIFVVPESATGFAFSSKGGTIQQIKLSKQYQPKEPARIGNLMMGGEIRQDVKGDGWEVK